MLLLSCLLCALTLCACSSSATGTGDESSSQNGSSDDTESASVEFFAMDTYMTITAYGENCEEAVEAAQEEVERLDTLLSAESTDGEVYGINHGETQDLSEDTLYLIECSLELYESTNGAFDIAIYPVAEAWGFTTGEYAVPEDETLEELLTLTDASQISLDEDAGSISLGIEGMEIGLGGIAKGYASSQVMEIFEEYGIESGLVNLGGNVQALGYKTDGSEWRVAIQDPDDTDAYLGIVTVADRAVITSGGYERYFEEDGVTYHHIIDPATGYPADNGIISATVVSDDGTLADGLSTSLFVMGYEDAVAYWREHADEFDMILVDEDHTIYVSEGIADSFTSDSEFEMIEAEE